MKSLLFASLLLASPAFAQQQSPPPTTPNDQALEVMLNRALAADKADLLAGAQCHAGAADLQNQVAQLQKQLSKPPSKP